MKYLRDSGGIALTLDLDGLKYDIVEMHAIQLIIGDCKENDLLYGRKDEHSLLMNELCRDCDIIWMDGDKTYNDAHLIFKYVTIDTIIGKDSETIER